MDGNEGMLMVLGLHQYMEHKCRDDQHAFDQQFIFNNFIEN